MTTTMIQDKMSHYILPWKSYRKKVSCFLHYQKKRKHREFSNSDNFSSVLPPRSLSTSSASLISSMQRRMAPLPPLPPVQPLSSIPAIIVTPSSSSFPTVTQPPFHHTKTVFVKNKTTMDSTRETPSAALLVAISNPVMKAATVAQRRRKKFLQRRSEMNYV